MEKKRTPKQFWELYNKLPQELKDAVFADETWQNVTDIFERYDTPDMVDFASDGIKDVLLGILPPNEFLDSLGKKLGKDSEAKRRIVHELNRFVFFPVKAPLEQMYDLKMMPIAGTPAGAKPEEKQESAYRESF